MDRFENFEHKLKVVIVETDAIDLPVAQPEITATNSDDYLPMVAQFSIDYEGYSITNPFKSSCGRFFEKPENYGLTEDEALLMASMNKSLYEAQVLELDSLARQAQDAMGTTDGGPADAYLMGKQDDISNAILAKGQLMAGLMINELHYGASPDARIDQMRALVAEMEGSSDLDQMHI